jgi:hypothetical protein
MTKRPRASRPPYKQLVRKLSNIEAYYTAWELHVGVVLNAILDRWGQKAWERKRKPRGWDETWPVIVNQGIIGALAILLNEGPPAVLGQLVAWSRARGHQSIGALVHDLHNATFPRYDGTAENPWAPLFRRVRGFVDVAHQFKLGGWKLVQIVLLLGAEESMPPAVRRLLLRAVLESLVFERFGFVISHCKHGDHWFVSDDRRRKDCVAHRLAGQQARWRKRHPGRKRRVRPSKPKSVLATRTHSRSRARG